MTETTKFHGQGDPLMEVAFASCVRWAWSDPEMRAEFERCTGKRLPQTELDQAIDEATGHEDQLAEEFVAWVIKDVWGQ